MLNTQNFTNGRFMRLQEEQNWLNSVNEAKAMEDDFLHSKKIDDISDLRNTYAQQKDEKRLREKVFFKE